MTEVGRVARVFFDLCARRGEKSTSCSGRFLEWKHQVLQTTHVIHLPRPRPDLKVVTYLCRTPGTNLVSSKASDGLTDLHAVPLAV